MIIDAHVHILPDPHGFGEKFDASLEHLLSSMDALPIDKAITLPIAPMASNAFIYESCAKHPGKLIGFATCEIKEKNFKITDVMKEIEEYSLKGLKLHPRIQNFGIREYERVFMIVKEMTSKKLPIIIDSFPYGNTLFEDDSLKMIDALARDLPQAKLIVAHSGGIQLMKAFLVAKKHPNIYLDISFILLYFKGSSIIMDLGFLMRNLGINRVIYGSDSPQMDMGEYYRETIHFFDTLGLSNRETEDIFANNILGLLGV